MRLWLSRSHKGQEIRRCEAAVSRVPIVERSAGFVPSLIRSGQWRSPRPGAASCPYIGWTPDGLHTNCVDDGKIWAWQDNALVPTAESQGITTRST
jgi:hypothetical protein